jgi:DNA helicase-2/ATP-dependent DNA helicase PcrA
MRSWTSRSSCRPPTSLRTGNCADAARRLVTTYVHYHEADLHRVWETERPFELHLDGVTVSGRADVILDQEGGVPTALAIVDHKTSTTGEPAEHALQLQVYADAGLREGLDVRARTSTI